MSQLEAERDDLCAKIQAGEGETAVLNQLKDKNQALQGQVGKCTLILWRGSLQYKLFCCLIFMHMGFLGYTADRQTEKPIREQQTSSG